MHLTPAMQNFILHWGEMGSKWGVNRSVAQIHALLHISPEALTAEEICGTLNLARSNVSNGLKELQAQGLVKSSRQLGDRRDHFTSIRDMFDLVDAVVAARREREFAPTLRALEQIMAEAEEDNTPKVIKARMGETLRVMQMFDDWYMDFSRLPRAVHLAVLKMGSKLVRFLPGGKSD
ncbi:MarR family transcriptional regulator [Phaeobacter sp. PT47_59]|uniref:GbsR/MarR family transcriptional regulator n=1 Tax=Phaeobacter sp. PT47_59 TaxID=3029979 RepID=UPI00237FEB5D|nr:MarR family transcriptional regulator [Phaeobacter sp. PT47_59]MDE4174830.1 MarR family transcriptional regulator [Phaeobacter sp. PT47_59]